MVDLAQIELGDLVGFDLETNGVDPLVNDILIISITSLGKTHVLVVNDYTQEEIYKLLLRITVCKVIGHNLDFELGFIYHKYGIMFLDIWDTMLMYQVYTNGIRTPYSLDAVLNQELGLTIMNKPQKKYYQQSFIGMKVTSTFSEEQLEYAGQDTAYLIPLYEIQKAKIEELELVTIARLEHKLLPVLVKMELGGCRIDVNAWKEAIDNDWNKTRDKCVEDLDSELLELNKINGAIPKKYLKKRNKQSYEVFDLFGGSATVLDESSTCFNYSSSKQILELFTILNLPIPQVEDNGVVKYTAGEDALRTYLTEYPRSPMRKFIELLLKYREYEKLISTYGHSFLSKLDANGYIHTSYTPCFTHTGRLSSRSPNLQNIPATDLVKDGYDIRQYFLADPGHVMITCDMEGAEVRIAADYSQEPKLIASILNDEDLHSKLASKSYSIIFGQKVKIDKSNDMLEVDGMKFKKRELRDTHKSVLFAKFYKGGAKRIYGVLAEYINLFHDEGQMDVAGKISKAMDKELPILSKYLTSLIDEAKETGMLRGSKLGRIRYFDANVFGEAANYPIQNTNSEALKIALIKLDEYLEDKNARLVMNVHDEVVVSVHPSIAEEVAERVKKIMGEALGWFMQSIPGGASYSIEKHWKK